jgi:translation initiation factor 4G
MEKKETIVYSLDYIYGFKIYSNNKFMKNFFEDVQNKLLSSTNYITNKHKYDSQCKYYNNKWKSSQTTDKLTVLKTKINGLLNKITVDNFSKLVHRLLKFPINSAESLEVFINVIYDKMKSEHYFIPLYGILIDKLYNKNKKWVFENNEKMIISMRTIIVDLCQYDFKYVLQPMVKSTDDEQNLIDKKIRIGSILIIGELYNRKLIADKVLRICMNEFLVEDSDKVEYACKLLTHIWKKLYERNRKYLEECTSKLETFSGNNSINPRIKFAVMDVIDLYKKKQVTASNSKLNIDKLELSLK